MTSSPAGKTRQQPARSTGQRAPANTAPSGKSASDESVFHGFSLAAVLRMLSLEQKSASLAITCPDGNGSMTLVQGDLVHATYGGLAGESAAMALLSLPHTKVAARPAAGPTLRTISAPLEHLLIEALRLADEGNESQESEPAGATTDPELPQAPATINAADNVVDSAALAGFASTMSGIEGVRMLAIVDNTSGSLLFDTAPDNEVRAALHGECTALAVALSSPGANALEQERETLTLMGDVLVLTIWDAPAAGMTTSVILNRRGQVQLVRRAVQSGVSGLVPVGQSV